METLTLIFFVLTILVAGFLATQTIRRDIKARERTESGTRRVPVPMRPQEAQRALHSPALRHHAHKSPPAPPLKSYGR